MADALKVHLAYRRSVALADISTAVDNVFVQTPQGYLLSNNSVLVFDNVYGGLGLTEALWWSLEEYAKQLLRGADRDRSRWDRINIFPENARKLVSWLNEVNDEPDPSPDEPGPDDWWRIIRPGSQVRLYQRDRDDVAEGTLSESVWKGGIRYWVEASTQSMREAPLQDWPEGALTASPAGTGSTTPNAPTGLIPSPGSTSPASGLTRTASCPSSATSWPGVFPWPPAGVPGSSPYGPTRAYFEYERTARGEARVGRKLNGDGCPVLIVCWNDEAESVFQDLGSGMGIPLLTTTIKRLEEHGPLGNFGCWSVYGQPARIGQGRRASWLLPRCAHGGVTAGSTPT